MGAPAVELPNNSTWRSSAPAGTTEHMMSAAVTRRARASAGEPPRAVGRREERVAVSFAGTAGQVIWVDEGVGEERAHLHVHTHT